MDMGRGAYKTVREGSAETKPGLRIHIHLKDSGESGPWKHVVDLGK